MYKRLRYVALAVMIAVLLAAAGCTQEQDAQQTKEVELSYVEWSDAVAATNVIRVMLEDMGYEVKTTPVSAAAMWQAVASGDADAMVAAWLPTTHAPYHEALQDKVVNLGPNLEAARIGLVVPTYVTIDSIPQLSQHAEKFNGKIIGIDPGAGLMKKTENVVEEYNLERFKLIEGSGATMTASLKNAIDNNEWIVVTGWNPHWKFARWDLKYLEDPKGVYGGEEHINTIARKGLKQDMPQVYKLLDKFHWSSSDVEQLMAWNQQRGTTPYENAKRWVKEHPEQVQAWKTP